jgi:hypothetical protein
MRTRPILLLLGVLAAGCATSSPEPDAPPPLQTNRAPVAVPAAHPPSPEVLPPVTLSKP